MKPILFLFSILMLAVAPLRSTAQVNLYPPLNIQGAAMECSVYLTWSKPELPGGGTPQGLLGYNVYRDGNILAYVSGQDTTIYLDIDPPPCPSSAHNYWVTAYYDLSSYGYPGQFGESGPTDTITMTIICDRPMPFIETWDMGTFNFNMWTFAPAQGNWSLNSTSGNPAPAVSFTGAPALSGYNITLQSAFIDATFVTGCINLFIEFDLQLENIVNTGTESLTLEASSCDTSVVISTFLNNTSFGWQHFECDLNDFRTGFFKVSFSASGQNSSNIQQWLIDNIVVDFKCRPPVNVDAINLGDTAVAVTWDPPECDMGTVPNWDHITGYNVYSSDSAGNGPFARLNTAPVVGDTFVSVYPDGWNVSLIRYYVTDIQHDSATWIFLCESEPSDTVTAHFTGIGPKHYSTCNIYPNPNKGIFTADLPPEAVFLEISDLQGRKVLRKHLAGKSQDQLLIDISGQIPGIYLLTITTSQSVLRGKVLVN